MYAFPGKPLSFVVNFVVGEDPVSPTTAAFTLSDVTGEVISTTAITLTSPGDMSAIVTIPDTAHVLAPGEKFRQFQVAVDFNYTGGVFEQRYGYYLIPELFLGFDINTARLLLGAHPDELPGTAVDYYRAYIDLATSEIGTVFYEAIVGSDLDKATSARNLIFYSALRNVIPFLQLNTYKSIESETSKITRGSIDFTGISSLLDSKYFFYYSQFMLEVSPASAPTLLVLDTPTDAITGA